MKFKIDENLPLEVAELLRSGGHSVRTVQDEGLVGAADDSILTESQNEARVLITLDQDFADIRTYLLVNIRA